MRITEAARRLGTSARMLRYRDALGLLPRVREDTAGAGHRHRRFGAAELDAVTAALRLEQRYDISPAALAFGLRVLAEPPVRAAVADLGRRVGRLPEPPGRALDFEKERALRLLTGPAVPGTVTGAAGRAGVTSAAGSGGAGSGAAGSGADRGGVTGAAGSGADRGGITGAAGSGAAASAAPRPAGRPARQDR